MNIKAILAACAILAFANAAFCADGRFVLVEKGEAKVCIVRSPGVEGAANFFVAEAAKCGVKFKSVGKPSADCGNILFDVAERPLAEQDAYEIVPQGADLVVRCTERSARWAVNRILHDAFGVRWLFSNPEMAGGKDINEYPCAGDVTLPAGGIRQKPYDFHLGRNPSWRVRDLNRYDCVVAMPHVHSMFDDVFPWRKYATDNNWPEAILPVRGGKKFVPPRPEKFPPATYPISPLEYRSGWNICFTDPKAADVAIADILEDLKRRPNALVRSIDLNDNGGMCECAGCRAAVGGRTNSMRYPDWSAPFWTFANKVVSEVAKSNDAVRFYAIAYREANDAPPFKLDPHLAPRLCFEINEMIDPFMHDQHMKTLAAWSKCASAIDIYDYNYGVRFYMLPRVYFTEWPRLVREIKRTFPAVSSIESESTCNINFDGPRLHVMAAVLRDVDVDPWKVVHDWCVDAVGEAAAKDLEAYYRFWDDYWRGDRIRRTAWFRNSVRNIYMQLGEKSTHAFALERGDMAKCRRLMEGVVAKAVTPMQKKRAKVLMDYFELSENAATGVLAEYVEPESRVKDAQTAVAMLDAVPAACAAIAKLPKDINVTMRGPIVNYSHLSSVLALTLPYKDDPAVKAAYGRLAADGSLPAVIRKAFVVWNGANVKNLIQNGSFEQESPMPSNWAGTGLAKNVRRTKADATDGGSSLEMGLASVLWRIPAQPEKSYMLVFDVKAVKGSAEGRFDLILSLCGSDNVPHSHFYSRDHVLPGGEWVTMSMMAKSVKGRTDNFMIRMATRKYEPDEKVLIDNVRFLCVDDEE